MDVFRISLAGDVLHSLDGRLHLLKQAGEVAEVNAVACAFNRSATGVAHNDNELRPRNFAGKFQASNQIGVGDVAGDASVEEVSNAGVENELGRRTGINAAQEGGARILASGGDALIVE